MSSVVLWTQGTESLELNEDQPTLPGGLEKIEVNKGQWIVYNEKYYGGPSGESKIYIAPSGVQSLTEFPPASIREVPTYKSQTQAVMLYEHINFGGSAMKISGDNPNVEKSGILISSVIVSGGKWRLFREKDYRGLGHTLGEGSYATPHEMGIPNDTLKSIQKVSD